MRLLMMVAEFVSMAVLFAPPADTPPKKGGLVFPEVVPADNSPPAPKPLPGAVAKLTGEMLYVVPSDSPFLLFASPMDKVTITSESGPIRIRGRFLDGSGKVETRNYSAKHVAIIEAAGTGRVELIAVPGGAVDEKEAVRLAIDVEAGQGPQPPPKPDPDVIPPPKPKPEPVKAFRVIFVYESGDTLTGSQNSVIYGVTVEEFLTANCTGGKLGWARRDKDVVGKYDAGRQAVWDAVKDKKFTTPCVVIQVNDTINIQPLAASPSEQIKVFRKFMEGQ